MQKILKQVGIKTLYSKDKLKIYGKGMIDARGKKLLVPNLEITEFACRLLFYLF